MISDRVVREHIFKKVMLSFHQSEEVELGRYMGGGRFQAEETANAKVLRYDCTWCACVQEELRTA